MGRQQFLIRLALGRSPFQELDEAQSNEQPAVLTSGPLSNELAESSYTQQYDTKGRPINPATETRNAEMRRAQNSILALVGVVQERDRREQSEDERFRAMREARQATLQVENDTGYHMTVLPLFIRLPCEWWIDCLLKRCVIGLHHAETPFYDILRITWAGFRSGGVKGWYAVLFPGSVASFLHQLAGFLPGAALDQYIIGPLEQMALKEASRRSRRKMFLTIAFFRHVILLAIELAILPLGYYSVAQELALAPAIPLLPPSTSMLPGRASSVLTSGWQGTVSIPVLQRLTSPVALLLLKSFLWSDLDDEEETPINPVLTSFRTPQVNEASESNSILLVRQDPLGWILKRAHQLRRRVLYWCGWTLVKRAGRSDEHEANISKLEVKTKGPMGRYRSSTLAHLPAMVLADLLDSLIGALPYLPLQTLTLRAVATTYMASCLPKTPIAIMNHSRLYGASNSLRQGGSIVELSHYASKLGLCLALKTCTEILIFGSIYRSVRRQGIRDFNWGSRCFVGDLQYDTPVNPIDRNER